MSNNKIVILDGSGNDDDYVASPFSTLIDVLKHHNVLALAICRCFADRCGITWAGSLAMAAGEALGSEQDLTQVKRSGPPVKHVIQALDMAGEAFVKGGVVLLMIPRG